MNKKNDIGQVEIFKSERGPQIEVRLDDETVWLSQRQMAEVFDRDSDTVGLHLKNIYKTNELSKESTTEQFSVVQKEGGRQVRRSKLFYNLDAIISVGYRVNSKRGTQFRIWATNTLKQHLVQGYTVNEKRLGELQKTIKLLKRAADSKDLTSDEAQGLFSVLSDYSHALNILDDYDYQRLNAEENGVKATYIITYTEACEAIDHLREKFGGTPLFGKQKDNSFESSISTVNQTFGGKELYSTLEEKAAHLLYFVTKNHSFVDGNKRIAAWLFIWYLKNNNALYSNTGNKRIADNALVALTLMIAQSDPEEMETMIKVVVNLIDSTNQ